MSGLLYTLGKWHVCTLPRRLAIKRMEMQIVCGNRTILQYFRSAICAHMYIYFPLGQQMKTWGNNFENVIKQELSV